MFERTMTGIAYDFAMDQPEGVGTVFFQVRDAEDGESYLLFDTVHLARFAQPAKNLMRSDYGRAVMLTGATTVAMRRAQAEGFEVVT